MSPPRRPIVLRRADAAWERLRLRDRVPPRPRAVFVGINPGVRSALTGHHFAGPSNRFWRLLYESGLVPKPISWPDDGRLAEWGFGITNLVARPTPGVADLSREEFARGAAVLARKVRRWRPERLALVGVTVVRQLLPFVEGAGAVVRVELGRQRGTFAGCPLFVLPNPSGRNANFSYAEMLAAFRALRRELDSRV